MYGEDTVEKVLDAYCEWVETESTAGESGSIEEIFCPIFSLLNAEKVWLVAGLYAGRVLSSSRSKVEFSLIGDNADLGVLQDRIRSVCGKACNEGRQHEPREGTAKRRGGIR